MTAGRGSATTFRPWRQYEALQGLPRSSRVFGAFPGRRRNPLTDRLMSAARLIRLFRFVLRRASPTPLCGPCHGNRSPRLGTEESTPPTGAEVVWMEPWAARTRSFFACKACGHRPAPRPRVSVLAVPCRAIGPVCRTTHGAIDPVRRRTIFLATFRSEEAHSFLALPSPRTTHWNHGAILHSAVLHRHAAPDGC